MKNKFLVVLIVILILLVGGLGYYTYFMWNKEVVSKSDLSSTEMSSILDKFPYQMLIKNKSIEVKDLTTEQIVYIGYEGLNESQIVLGDSSSCDATSTDVLVKCVGKKLGLADEQINTMNVVLWEDYLGGSTAYEMFSPELINTIIENKLGLTNQFTKSFSKSIGFSCSSISFVYDKDINMFFAHEDGGCSLGLNYVINIDSGYKESNTYKIKFTEGVFAPIENAGGTENPFNLYSRSNPTAILESSISTSKSESEMKALVKKYKTDLDNYEITFKKVGNNYKFVSLDYIK